VLPRPRKGASAVTKPEPPDTLSPPPTPPVEDPMAALRPRLAEVRRRFSSLVSKYGEGQLTTLEKAAVAETLAAGASQDHTALATALPDAEQALSDAERRLGR
jgi:hypothetical protein